MDVDATGLERSIKYRFVDQTLLNMALTHPSYGSDHNNERLEFLGDAVLELCVSETLYKEHLFAKEGELTKRRAAAVCGRSLAKAAQAIGLGKYLLLGKGEEMTGGREKQSVLENAMEALLGAVYLDGGLMAAKKVVRAWIPQGDVAGDERDISANASLGQDCKSILQERVQSGKGETIRYETYRVEGPPHSAVFYVRVHIGETAAGEGRGKSKKEAEQKAAQKALKKYKK